MEQARRTRRHFPAFDPSDHAVKLATTRPAIARCVPALQELRPHLADAETLIAQVLQQQASADYRLAFLEEDGRVCSVAGYRIMRSLAWGRFLYVDDFVTLASERGKGYGARLMHWLLAAARFEHCEQAHLDSGVHRFAAHALYIGHGMEITCHHFAFDLRRHDGTTSAVSNPHDGTLTRT